jgi:hypothetical protein
MGRNEVKFGIKLVREDNYYFYRSLLQSSFQAYKEEINTYNNQERFIVEDWGTFEVQHFGNKPSLVEEFSFNSYKHILDRGNTFELTNVCIKKEKRSIKSFRILLSAIFHYCVHNDVDFMVANIEPSFYQTLKILKIPIIRVGELVYPDGTKEFPIIFYANLLKKHADYYMPWRLQMEFDIEQFA